MDVSCEYYRALDTGSYDDLAALLAPEFTQYRPDRTFEGREAFVKFMREDRPMTDTTHEIGTVYAADEGVAVRGRLLDGDDEELFGFVDVHEFADGELTAIYTYTR